MCRIQHGGEVPHQLTDGEVFIIPKPGGSGPDYMRFFNLLDSTGKLLFWILAFLRIGPTQTLAVRFH